MNKIKSKNIKVIKIKVLYKNIFGNPVFKVYNTDWSRRTIPEFIGFVIERFGILVMVHFYIKQISWE